MNGMNMGKLMQQAQEMQRKMSAQQSEIEKQDFTGTAPDGLVTATFTGARQMKDLQIKPEAIDPDDPDMLSDLVISAVNDALGQIDETTKSKMGQFTQGMNIPGL
ncbi:YbaB/EbfC family nucleoid-associated protein [Fructilactobacillus myrtifloralis]|uniref:Nucleoid-associated protein M3M35_06465 n=1 Tax=Fructilactobacillus myrtifloralis TaxID=2940301 RepID=A0ABY5BU86_9LACO|nr:YbaB/EbfC family nucleoid-associated protein [Fructilactobacillus myrtifloralis]USS85818.1 YbaB/EbfC family nucleoid-associated protein [Fructilactobacillus myrtifloralis]